MRLIPQSLPATIATLASILVLGCQPTGRTDPPQADSPPLTAVEIPRDWHLDQINSLYRDREQLASGDRALYAASMRRTVDEARAYVTELLDAHMRAFYLQRLNEDGDSFPGDPHQAREYVAEIIASHVNMATQEVRGDIERIEAILPSVGKGVMEAGVRADGGGDCSGEVDIIAPKTHLFVVIDDRLPDGPWWFWLSANAHHHTTNPANHVVTLHVEMTGDIGYDEYEHVDDDACTKSYGVAQISELWNIDRVASFCASARGYHTASTDDGSRYWDSYSNTVCDTVYPPNNPDAPGEGGITPY